MEIKSKQKKDRADRTASRKFKNSKEIERKSPERMSAQSLQDEIFRKMPVEKKIDLTSELTAFCLKLNKLK